MSQTTPLYFSNVLNEFYSTELQNEKKIDRLKLALKEIQ